MVVGVKWLRVGRFGDRQRDERAMKLGFSGCGLIMILLGFSAHRLGLVMVLTLETQAQGIDIILGQPWRWHIAIKMSLTLLC